MNTNQIIKTELNNLNQNILLNYDKIFDNTDKQNEFYHSINIEDIKMINNLYDELVLKNDEYNYKILNSKYTISPACIKFKRDYLDDFEVKALGEDVIKSGSLGIIMLAAGLGTRLGHNGPKGTYKLQIDNREKSLFEIFIDKCLYANKKYNVIIPIYIMCSKNNYNDTVKFFNENAFFNYDKEKIIFFTQGETPITDTNGMVLISKEGKPAYGPNGNGDLFKSLKKNGLDVEILKQNLKWLMIFGIDNIMLDIIDPLFIGLTIKNNLKLGCKSISKPDDKTRGYVFARQNNKFYLIENGKITNEMANAKDKDGNYIYRETNIACHLIATDLLPKFINMDLNYHTALRKTSYLDENGNIVVPDKPNSYKYEKFIYEAFYDEDNALILSVGKDEFSPLKNKTGDNSPETVVNDYNFYNKKSI